MTTLRSYIDSDRQTPIHEPTAFMTERNQRGVRCGMCGKVTYVDEDTFQFASDAISAGLDDPFRCEICQEEYDDLAYEG